MDLALIIQQSLIYHKINQPTNQPTNQPKINLRPWLWLDNLIQVTEEF